MREAVKVMVVDDHTIFRQGLVKLLESYRELQVLAQAGCASEAIDLLNRVTPYVIVMDIKMPGMDGVQAMEQIKKKSPEVKVVILSMYDDAAYVLRTIRAGASGYVQKSASVERLIDTIISSQMGQKSHFNLAVDSDVLLKVNEAGAHGKRSGLSDQERKVLRLLAEGRSNKEIAESMFLSEQTVKGYIHNILRKLDASDRTQAAVMALREGLLD